MRLFGKVDGTIDRLDRAAWLTTIFDLAFGGAPIQGTRYPDPSRSTIRVLADEPGTYAARVRVLPATPDSSRIKQL